MSSIGWNVIHLPWRLGAVKVIAALLVVWALAGCAAPDVDVRTPTSRPTPSPTGSPSPEPRTALELLKCRAEASDVGGVGEEVASAGGGATPDEALATFLANTPYVIPRSGYEAIGRSGDRHAYGFRADGDVKVVVIVSPRFSELIGAAFTADELRTCPGPEFGAEAQFDDGRRVWTDVETGRILTDIAGPQHCGWQSARMMHLENADGTLGKQYLRDPLGVFADIPSLLDTYAEGVDLPADASDSGYRSPEGLELWFTESDTAAYVITPEGVERWPRAAEPIGCA